MITLSHPTVDYALSTQQLSFWIALGFESLGFCLLCHDLTPIFIAVEVFVKYLFAVKNFF